jgi:dipeptidyl aminopeptidase/acylaminoacyl peptidase
VQAVSFNRLREEWRVLDADVAPDLAALAKVADGDVRVTSRTRDDRLWTVALLCDDGPARHYLWDRAARRATFLFTARKALEGVRLAKMRAFEIRARDGLSLPSYLTLPPGEGERPGKPLPMVLFVHGGPHARDAWGGNAVHQWLANRGYAVLSVNYRGSTGFGKAFVNAGDLEWAGKMHDDLVDAVRWAVESGVADANRVAISGGSYGGYAALVGLTFTPDLFACAVDVVGPSNIVTLIRSVPAYWLPLLESLKRRVGDPDTPQGLALLTARSPLTHVAKIARPLLIAQGANDPRVKQAESDQIVDAMKARGIPVTYVLFPDEGHGFARPENSTAFRAVEEAFLATHLGGRSQPVGGDFAGSSIQIREGRGQIPGLEPAAT